MKYTVVWTVPASDLLGAVSDQRVRQQIFERSKGLETDPEKQGYALRAELLGYRSLRVVGQRYRILYAVDEGERLVQVVAAGLRKEGDRRDIYALAAKLVRTGLIVPTKRGKPQVAHKKKARKKR